MSAIIGIDIAKDKFDVLLLRPEQKPEPAVFDNNHKGFEQGHRFLKKRNAHPGHVCMEATGVYYEALAHFLHQKGYSVSVVNPLQIKAYAQSQLRRNKTDQVDAAVLADFCRTQNPPLWTPPDPAWYELRTLVRHLEDLEADRQRQRNRQEALKHSAQPSPTVLKHRQQHLEFLSQQIEQVKAHIQDHIDQHPTLKQQRDLLDSIKGIGPLTASKLLSEYRDMRQFDSVGQVVAFAGLNPKQHQSGSSVRGKTVISKIGRASIRAALYMPAINAKRFNPLLRPFVERLQQRGVSEMEIVVAVMRKLLHLAFGVLKSGQPFDPDFLNHPAATS
jgi:transposase